MEARLVYNRVDDEALTPLQRVAHKVIDGYIEQNIPAYLKFKIRGRPDDRYGSESRNEYQIIVKQRGWFFKVRGWDGVDTVEGLEELDPRMVDEHTKSELDRQEQLMLESQTAETGGVVPLSSEDYKAIGISQDDNRDNGPAGTGKAGDKAAAVRTKGPDQPDQGQAPDDEDSASGG